MLSRRTKVTLLNDRTLNGYRDTGSSSLPWRRTTSDVQFQWTSTHARPQRRRSSLLVGDPVASSAIKVRVVNGAAQRGDCGLASKEAERGETAEAARILVAYASNHGATMASPRQRIGQGSSSWPRGRQPAPEVVDLASYDAVVAGSAPCAAHWRREASEFVRGGELVDGWGRCIRRSTGSPLRALDPAELGFGKRAIRKLPGGRELLRPGLAAAHRPRYGRGHGQNARSNVAGVSQQQDVRPSRRRPLGGTAIMPLRGRSIAGFNKPIGDMRERDCGGLGCVTGIARRADVGR